MIEIKDKSNCCGCRACAQACPKSCISMLADQEGFLYPQVDHAQCIDCGLCERVCPELNIYEAQMPLHVAAAVNRDADILKRSSSGGVFNALAQHIIKRGGVVFGARYDSNWQVVIDHTETIEGIASFMGSKYVQASTGTAFSDARKLLEQGREVLFSGTPCQIAGLKHYLRKDYPNLLTVDIICHGTPSPKVWEKYLKQIASELQAIKEIDFRNKEKGWKGYNFKLQYNDKEETITIQMPFTQNTYMKAFLSDMILRPSCYDCCAKSGRSHSDITIADFWGISSVFPELDDDRGTGLVIINSDRGKFLLEMPELNIRLTELEQAIACNPSYLRSVKPHRRREQFFKKIDKTEDVISLIRRCTRPSLKSRVRRLVGKCKRMLIGRGIQKKY